MQVTQGNGEAVWAGALTLALQVLKHPNCIVVPLQFGCFGPYDVLKDTLTGLDTGKSSQAVSVGNWDSIYVWGIFCVLSGCVFSLDTSKHLVSKCPNCTASACTKTQQADMARRGPVAALHLGSKG